MPTLFNHTLLPQEEYRTFGAGVEKYEDFARNGGRYALRALALTYPNDALQIDPMLSEELAYLQSHLSDLGVETTQNIILSTQPEEAFWHDSHNLSVYLFDESFHTVRPDRHWLAATQRLGDKNTFAEWCEERGHPVPATVVVEPEAQPDFSKLHYPALLKPAQTSNGVGIVEVNGPTELARAIRTAGPRYQVQEKVPDVVASVSVQYDMTNGEASHVVTTEQIVNGFTHGGNVFPTKHNPRDITDPLAVDAAAEGMQGRCGLDVVVTADGDVSVIEMNPRYTGASYVADIAKRLEIPEWAGYKLSTSLRSPSELHERELLQHNELIYNSARKAGVIIMNNALLRAKGQLPKVEILVAGTADERPEILDDLSAALQPLKRRVRLPAHMLSGGGEKLRPAA